MRKGKALIGLAALALPGLVLGGPALAGLGGLKASPRVLAVQDKACTSTNPEYILQNNGAQGVTYNPGSPNFTVKTPSQTKWMSVYDVTGFSRGNNSAVLCGLPYAPQSYVLPYQAGAGAAVTSSMTYSGKFAGRPGWDIWLVPSGHQTTETTATLIERDPGALEIMIQPPMAGYGTIVLRNTAWHRVYYSVKSFSGVNVAAIINAALTAEHLPSSYYVMAIDGGWEGLGGTFQLTSYALSVTVSGTATASYTATESVTVTSGRFTATASATTRVVATRTVTSPVKGAALPVIKSRAVASAQSLAAAASKASAISAAQAQARQAALLKLWSVINPKRQAPEPGTFP